MRGLYQRLKSFIVLIKHYDRYIIDSSYYMEYEHKSSVRIDVYKRQILECIQMKSML